MTGDELLAVPSVVHLVDRGQPVEGPEGVVYSTSPRVCTCTSGSYFVKGDSGDPGMVAAEVVGYTLARSLKIDVPEFAIARDSQATFFASKNVDGCIRDALPFVRKHLGILTKVIVLDVLLFNNDRNVGGFVAHPKRGLVALDFEKSKAVRQQHPLIQLASFQPRSIWPQGVLGTIARGAAIPGAFVREAKSLSDAQLRSATLGAAQVVPGYTWAEASELALRRRRDKLEELVREVWQ
ncbi:MAG TPA: hypothetical protein VK524_27035 [Polyangiaceae bacterium]|nr:hypothetical protein [Polyangiaceae bacterium]